ncbi:hypothetical protein PIB30_006684 [Stylosanthes scabra]|uniref:FBD domain-containing protein n=1 Tax=Stylosanthes scabra TaxID=79078 RepID=A0ABU6R498_9FABA|nr:hypothetical protein [Stylosanthes scabra]
MDAITLPQGILTCPSLNSLVLKGYISLDYGLYLPSLKNLELDIHCVDPNKLLSGCPVLENLKLRLRNFDPEYNCYDYVPTIQMPRTLKSLTLLDLGDMYEEINHRVIETPSLEYLHITEGARNPGDSELHFSFGYFPNMLEAHVDISDELIEHVDWVVALLQALRETKLLTLARYTTKYLFIAPAFEFPEFRRMLNLEVDIPCFNTKFLLNFLHNCPVLEGLVIHTRQVTELPPEYNGPTPPTIVPKCVTSHLKSFEFRGYQDYADEREFIACVLQRGLVLKTMTIKRRFGFNLKTKDDIIRGLCAIPWGSTTCQLNFIERYPF